MNDSLASLMATALERSGEFDEWAAAEFSRQRVPFYCSVDLRACGHKIAPVDTNLFPGGFNNLSQVALGRAASAAKRYLDGQWPGVKDVLVVTERHTRNPFYANHLAALCGLLEGAGANVRLAFLEGGAETLEGHHRKVEVGELTRCGDELACGDFVPELVILNHDQTSGTPEVLVGAAQPMVPPPQAGWAHRRKSAHFFQYERVAARYARVFDADPWLLSAYFNVCSKVDLSRNIGLDCLVQAVEETLEDIRANYRRHGVDDRPFVTLKSDAGTYGMGVVMVEDAEDARRLNRRQRKNLATLKQGVASTDILIQEGIPTTDRVEGLVAEPVLYMVGTEVVGGFWRLNQSKGERDNLNSKGMLFWSMGEGKVPEPGRAAALETVARLALLATTREIAGEAAAASSMPAPG